MPLPIVFFQVAGMLLGGTTLKFYQWEGDVTEHLDGVRRKINALAEGWTEVRARTPNGAVRRAAHAADCFVWLGEAGVALGHAAGTMAPLAALAGRS